VALTNTLLPAAGLVGPGIELNIHTSNSGPYPNDDFVSVTLSDDATGTDIMYGLTVDQFGSSNVRVVLGIIDPTHTLVQPHIFFGLAQGAGVHLTAIWQHANLSVFDGPTTFSGFHWDSLTGLLGLLRQSGSGGLADILGAVSRAYPATH
jgi:hypothetical protein